MTIQKENKIKKQQQKEQHLKLVEPLPDEDKEMLRIILISLDGYIKRKLIEENPIKNRLFVFSNEYRNLPTKQKLNYVHFSDLIEIANENKFDLGKVLKLIWIIHECDIL